jgi:hypothetical protein
MLHVCLILTQVLLHKFYGNPHKLNGCTCCRLTTTKHIQAKKILKVQHLLKFVVGVHKYSAHLQTICSFLPQISQQSKYLAILSQFVAIG